MRCIEDVGNQKLVDAFQLQGNLIGNLAHEKARMTAQFSLLDWELTRRAQRGTLVTTREAPGTASVRGGGAEQGTGAVDEGSREHSPASGHGRGSGNGNRGSWDRARSRRQRSPSATREPETADVAHATTRSPREPQTRDKIREGTSSRSREPSVRGSERRFTGNTGNLLDSASPYRDIRLADRGRAGNRARFAEIADSWTATTTRIGAGS